MEINTANESVAGVVYGFTGISGMKPKLSHRNKDTILTTAGPRYGNVIKVPKQLGPMTPFRNLLCMA